MVGAHLSGMPLNGELTRRSARASCEATATAPDYRLYRAAGGEPPKPGLLRVAAGAGAAIEVEVWALTAEAFGRFVAAIPPPLGIGTLRLADGRTRQGLPGRGRGGRRRARHFAASAAGAPTWRLALELRTVARRSS